MIWSKKCHQLLSLKTTFHLLHWWKWTYNYFFCKGSVKDFFLSCCCLKTVSPIHKILQELGFPTTKLSMSTGKELVTNNLSHNCEIAFSSFLQHYIFAYSWNWSSVPLHKKQTKNLFSNFFLIFRKEGWRFGEIYWFFFIWCGMSLSNSHHQNSKVFCLHLSLHYTRN